MISIMLQEPDYSEAWRQAGKVQDRDYIADSTMLIASVERSYDGYSIYYTFYFEVTK